MTGISTNSITLSKENQFLIDFLKSKFQSDGNIINLTAKTDNDFDRSNQLIALVTELVRKPPISYKPSFVTDNNQLSFTLPSRAHLKPEYYNYLSQIAQKIVTQKIYSLFCGYFDSYMDKMRNAIQYKDAVLLFIETNNLEEHDKYWMLIKRDYRIRNGNFPKKTAKIAALLSAG